MTRDTSITKEMELPCKGWQISFSPNIDFIQARKDPTDIFTELATLGELTVKVNDSLLPLFSELELGNSYLSWQLVLKGDIAREAITAIFSSVEQYCELVIEPISTAVVQQDRMIQQQIAGTHSQSAAAQFDINKAKVAHLTRLMNQLLIKQDQLRKTSEQGVPQINEAADALDLNIREMQEAVMALNLLPIGVIFNDLSKFVNELALQEAKNIDFTISGEHTELDSTALPIIAESLKYLVQHCVQNSIETIEDRIASAKPETALMALSVYQRNTSIIIEITDDGIGLNEQQIIDKAIELGLIDANHAMTLQQVNQLILTPEFSRSGVIADVEGTSAGFVTVNNDITDLGGNIVIEATKAGNTKYIIQFPINLGVLDGQLVRVDDEIYILPVDLIIEALTINTNDISAVAGKGEVYYWRDEYIPIIHLNQLVSAQSSTASIEQVVLVVNSHDQKVGLMLDEILEQQRVFSQSLATHYKNIDGISAGAIMHDARVALILDLPKLIDLYRQSADHNAVSAENGSKVA